MATKLKIYVIRPIRNQILFFLAKFLFLLAPLIPRRVNLFIFGLLAKVVFNYSNKQREIIISNLEMVYGRSNNPDKYYKIGKQLFVCLTKTFVDYARLGNKYTLEQFSRYFDIEGEENLYKEFEKGKGVLCLVPHTACWEFSAIMPPIMGYPSCGVSSAIKNPALNKLMIQMRESHGMENITRKHCYERLKEELNAGKCLIIMIDQDSINIRGEFLKFFGRDAYTPLGCARLAMDTGAAVVPMFTTRNNETERYTFHIRPSIPFEIKGEAYETLCYNTQLYNNAIESIIKEYPDQWIWFHERWKTTPETLKLFLENKRDTK